MALLLEFRVINTMTTFYILKDPAMSISVHVNELPFTKLTAILILLLPLPKNQLVM